MSDLRQPPHTPDQAYQHWLDDAANMGLMLYRMRNDSKRERMMASQPHPMPRRVPSTPQPPPPPSTPEPPLSPNLYTPRTTQALQTPTVATRSTNQSRSTPPLPRTVRPSAFHLPLD